MNDLDLSKTGDIVELFTITKMIFLLVGIVTLGFVARAASSFGSKFHKRFPSQRLLVAQVVTILSFLLYIGGGGYLFFVVVNPPKTLLVAVSGMLAVAFGLSLKDLISSVVAGLILIFDKPFQVGDRVSFSGMYGEVTSIGLRAVRLTTLDDSLITIPNNRFLSDAVSSGNSGALDMMIEINFHLSLQTDLVEARNILYDTAVTSRYVFLKKPVAIVMTEVEFAHMMAMQLRVKCYVLDVRFEKALQTDILLRGNKALIDSGLERPSVSLNQIQNRA